MVVERYPLIEGTLRLFSVPQIEHANLGISSVFFIVLARLSGKNINNHFGGNFESENHWPCKRLHDAWYILECVYICACL